MEDTHATSSHRGPRVVTEEHKAAMVQGRNESRAIRLYLEAIKEAGGRGRRLNKAQLEEKLAATLEELKGNPRPIKKLDLIQQRINLEERIAHAETTFDIEQLEQDFIAVAEAYSQRKGISHQAWREMGVKVSVLRQAKII